MTENVMPGQSTNPRIIGYTLRYPHPENCELGRMMWEYIPGDKKLPECLELIIDKSLKAFERSFKYQYLTFTKKFSVIGLTVVISNGIQKWDVSMKMILGGKKQ